MTSSLTISSAQTYTVVHARHKAAKVAADLTRIQRLYGDPSDTLISWYEEEAVELLRFGYLETATYGYQRNELWVPPTLRYTASDLAFGAVDDDPGKIKANESIVGAHFTSFVTYSAAWWALTEFERQKFNATLPIQRTTGEACGVHNGYFADDKTYAAGGRSLSRSSARSY
jgi:hypothetical protein